jgi:hypothetical protein
VEKLVAFGWPVSVVAHVADAVPSPLPDRHRGELGVTPGYLEGASSLLPSGRVVEPVDEESLG